MESVGGGRGEKGGGEMGRGERAIGWSDWGRVLEETRARRDLFCLSFEKRAQSFQNFQLFAIFVIGNPKGCRYVNKKSVSFSPVSETSQLSQATGVKCERSRFYVGFTLFGGKVCEDLRYQ